jgi:glycosyltransferase involved in cell wall biosynthesis
MPGFPEDSPAGYRVLRIADVAETRLGGMSGYMLESSEELTRLGMRVGHVWRPDLVPQVSSPAIRRLIVPWAIAWLVVRQRHRWDVVEIHEPLAAPYAVLRRLGGRLLPGLVVLSFGLEILGWRAMNTGRSRLGRRAKLRSRITAPLTVILPSLVGLRAADAVAVPSSADRNYLIRRLGRSPETVFFAPTGVDLPEAVERNPRRDEVSVLFLGTWIARKGIHELAAAWSIVSENRNVTLTVAGTAIDPAVVLRDFPLGAQGRITVRPTVSRDELEELLRAHDVFVLPSWFEGLPLSLLEAAAAGMACVATDVCGNADVFSTETDGALLVPPYDGNALATAIQRLVTDRSLRERTGAAARQRAAEFPWSRTATALRGALDRARR